jgi:hypothetical protein
MARIERNDLLWSRESGYRAQVTEELKVEIEWFVILFCCPARLYEITNLTRTILPYADDPQNLGMESILNGFAANSKEAKWKKRSNTIPFSSKKHLGTQNCIFPPFLRFCHLNHSFFTFDAPPQLKEWQKKIRQKESEIQQAEIDYLELQREKGRVSPRAIEQGWSEDLADNIEKGRKLVTDLKLEHILNLSFEARRSEEKLEQRKFRINEAIWWRNELNTWKDCELQDMWDRENARKHAEEHRAKVQAIADEKRRWSVLKTTILFCTFLIVRLLF